MRRLLWILSLIMAFSAAVPIMAADLILPSNPNGNYYNANGNIVSQGACTVQSGANVKCSTFGEITLNPGFETMSGSIFNADINNQDDTDADGLPDWWEYAFFNNLSYGANDDPDNDGLTNYQEYLINSNPTIFNKDNDNDGMEDWWELQYFGNLLQSPNADPDGDQLTNLQEYLLGTNPTVNNPDTDADGLLDWWELQYFGTLQYNRNDDPDGDGAINYVEYLGGSNPNNAGSKPKPGTYYEYDAIGRITKIYKVK